MFPSTFSPFAGLVKVIMVLVIIGGLMVLGLTNSDLTNFLTNSVKADAMRQQNATQAQMDAIDVKNYQIIQDTLTKSKIDQLLADDAAYQESVKQQLQLNVQKAAQEVETALLVSYLWIGAGTFLVFCVGIGIVLFAVKVGRGRQITTPVQVKQADPWQDPIWRKRQIWILRQQERAIREIRASAVSNVCVTPPFIQDETPITWNDLQKQYVEIKKP